LIDLVTRCEILSFEFLAAVIFISVLPSYVHKSLHQYSVFDLHVARILRIILQTKLKQHFNQLLDIVFDFWSSPKRFCVFDPAWLNSRKVGWLNENSVCINQQQMLLEIVLTISRLLLEGDS